MARNESLTPGTKNPPRVTGAILAGGFSSRLGQDKASLLLRGKTLTRWVAEALAPLVGDCWLITNHPGSHLALGLPLVTDLWPFQGPAGGLRTALFYARTSWVLAAAVDNPFLSPELLAGLTARLPGTSRPAVVCRSALGLEPFPGLYHVRLLPSLTAFLESQRRASLFLSECRLEVMPLEEVMRLDPEGRSFFNLNTPEDLERAASWDEPGPPRAAGEGPPSVPASRHRLS
ncbi:MAG: molybdenum cofactor guanylyltransferase [Desulfobaccales bacterium]